MVTAVDDTPRAVILPGRLTAEALALREKFPPRLVPARWEATGQDKDAVLGRLLAPPFLAGNAATQYHRRSGLIRIMQWLQAQPGQTWQDRWMASGIDTGTRADPGWRRVPVAWLEGAGRIAPGSTSASAAVGSGLLQLICGDVIRPGIAWLLTTTSHLRVAAEMARVRDTDGFAELRAVGQSSSIGPVTTISALARIAVIMAAKGGMIRDITVGDALELMRISTIERDPHGANGQGPYFYQLLHALGVFPPGAPSSVRLFSPRYHGQLTPEQLIDRYDLACRPVRDLLVDYLRERQPGLDYTTLATLACYLGRTFWKDLETCHPGIDSLDLAPDIAAAWKQRAQTKPAGPAAAAGPGRPGCPARAWRTASSQSARSTWTSRNGRPKTPPGGGDGRPAARSGPMTYRHARSGATASPGWTSGHANAFPPSPPWPPAPAADGKLPPRSSRQRRWPGRARYSQQPGSRCAAPC